MAKTTYPVNLTKEQIDFLQIAVCGYEQIVREEMNNLMDQHGGEILENKIRQKNNILEQCDRLWPPGPSTGTAPPVLMMAGHRRNEHHDRRTDGIPPVQNQLFRLRDSPGKL